MVVTINDSAMTVPQAELKDLPRIFIDSIRYEVPSGGSLDVREVSFDAGERGDPFASPPIPASIIRVTLCFNGGAYTSRMTTTTNEDLTTEVHMKEVGKPEILRGTIKKQPMVPIHETESKSK